MSLLRCNGSGLFNFYFPVSYVIFNWLTNLCICYNIQVEQCRKAIEELKKTYPDGIIEVLLLQATLEYKANRLEEALATLASAKPDSALIAGLAALQLLLEKREFDRATAHLEQLLKQHFRLGLLGSLVSLHSARGQRDKAISLVNEALDKFNKTKVYYNSVYRRRT